jgi:hypothetical protein
MRQSGWVALVLTLLVLTLLAACSASKQPAAAPVAAPESAKITQLYSTKPEVPKGETALLCYGVENATTVWMEPPRKELSAAQARCVEVAPERETTYQLTAVGPDGKAVTRELKIGVGSARVKIVNLNVSATQVKAGGLVSICYTVENAQAVEIAPIGYRGGAKPKGCATDQPYQSKTYIVRALGKGGEKDEERVTVQVN